MAGIYFKVQADFEKIIRLRKEIVGLTGELEKLDKVSAPREFKALESQIRANTLEMEKLSRSLAENQSKLRSTGSEADELTGSLGNVKNAAMLALTALGGGNLLNDVVRVRGEFQQLEISLETILSNKEKADKLMAEVVEFAAKTPFNLADVATGTKQLLAYGSQASNVIDELKMIGDVASGTSQPIGDLIYLYGTLQTQGRAFAMDIRQFTGRGVPMLEELSKVLKVSVSEVNDMISAGKVGFPQIQEAFKNMTSEGGKFFNLTSRNAESLTGLLSNMQDAWQSVLNNEGKKSQGLLSSGIKGITGELQDYEKYLNVLKALIAAYGTYKGIVVATFVIQKASLALDAAKAFNATTAALTRTTQAQILLNKALGASPFAKLAGLVMLAASALYLFNQRTDDAANLSKKTAESIASEKAELQVLLGIAKNENSLKGDRLDAIKKLNQISPEYLGNLSLENIATQDAAKSIDAYTKALEKNAKMKAAQDLISEKQRKVLENENKIAEVQSFYDKTPAGSESRGVYGGKIGRLQAENKQLQIEIDKILKLTQEGSVDTKKETVLSNITEETKNAVTNLSKLKKELSDLRSGKAPSENYKKAIEDKKTEIESAEKTLELLTGKKTSKNTDSNKFVLDSDTKLIAARIALMQEGTEKMIAQAKVNHKESLDQIDKEEKEKLAKYKEYIEKGGSPIKGAEEQIKSTASGLREAAAQQEAKDIADIQKKEAETTALLWKETSSRFASELDKQLAELDTYYAEAIKKAKDNQALIEQLNKNKTKDQNIARLNNQLYAVGFNEEISLNKNESSNTGMYELLEREKTSIMKKYALERISILRQMGTEQANADADVLQSLVGKYDSILSKAKPVKSLVDEKVFKAVQNHFVKLGNSEKEASEKTENFFQKFTDGGATAADAIGILQGAFGGLSEEADMAMEAASNIAQGFATGGPVGGIIAAGQEALKLTVKLITARKEIDKSMIMGYKAYIEVIDQLIDRQVESLETLGGAEFTATIKKVLANIRSEIGRNREMLFEAQKAGSGVFSHSDGYKANKILSDNLKLLKESGIAKTDLNKMNSDELIKLRDIADVWSKLPGEIRAYIDDLAASKDKLKELNEQLQDMLLGFDTSSISDAIVESFTDPQIDNAMADLSGKIDNFISGIMKNLLTNLLLTTPITSAINQLMKGLAVYDKDGNITGFKNISDIEKGVLSNFKNTIESLSQGFGETWKSLSSELLNAGIDINSQGSSSQSASSKGFQSMSQDTGSELNGRFTALQMAGEIISKQAESQTGLLNSLDMNVKEIKDASFELRDLHMQSVVHLAAINKSTSVLPEMADDIKKVVRNTENL